MGITRGFEKILLYIGRKKDSSIPKKLSLYKKKIINRKKKKVSKTKDSDLKTKIITYFMLDPLVLVLRLTLL